MIKKFKKTLSQELQKIFREYSYQNDGSVILEQEDCEFRYSAQIVTIAGRIFLRPFITLSNLPIEREWMGFKEELMIEQLYNPVTIVLSLKDYQTNLSKENNELDVTDLSDADFKEVINDLFAGYLKPTIGTYTDLKNCDSLLNKSHKIDDSNIPYSDLQSLPFRKMLLAKATNNVNLLQIEKEMRSYCEEHYELGKRENFEQLCMLKPVFEKLFGK